MSSPVKVDNLTVTLLESDYESVHPAIGVVDNIAYVGVWYPCSIEDDKGKVKLADKLFLVTSDRRRILANDSIVKEYGWRLEYKPTRFKNRWTLESVKAYLEGADVDPTSVFNAVLDEWKKYIEFSDERDYTYHALWDINTYFHFLFSAFPYAYHGGTTKTGKTKALTLSSLIAFNAVLSNNMSTASIFRLVQNCRATLLLDETERLSTKQMDTRIQEFRSILLSGYKRSGQAVWRVEKDKQTETQTLQPFDVYGPKRIANIQGLEDVVANRCKPTIHRRSIDSTITKIDPDIESKEWATLRGQLCILFLQHWREVKQLYDTLNVAQFEGLDGRDFELWKPIIALAEFFEGMKASETPQNTSVGGSLHSPHSLSSLMLDLAKATADQSSVENLTETGEAILIQVLPSMVESDDYVSVKAIRDKMLEQFDEKSDWITTRWVGNTLKRLGFKEKRRVGTGYQYRLLQADVKNLAERMGIKPSEHSEHSEGSERTTDVLLQDTLKLDRSAPNTIGKCHVCGFNGPMDWQVTLHNGTWALLCDSCGLKLEKRLNHA